VENTINKVLGGKYDISDAHWGKISADAKDLIAKMLKSDPNARITPVEALKHPWITVLPTLSSMLMHLES
jgi:serine/threonine protein kinase